jgi:hypothetical protein
MDMGFRVLPARECNRETKPYNSLLGNREFLARKP